MTTVIAVDESLRDGSKYAALFVSLSWESKRPVAEIKACCSGLHMQAPSVHHRFKGGA